jgi:hypothetical protein
MTIAKALTALIVGAIMALLGNYGLSETSTLVDIVGVLITAISVYFIPNKPMTE